MTHIQVGGRAGCSLVVIIGCSLLLIAGAAFGAEDGGYAGAPVQWGIGARPVAMGGAFAAVADGPTGFWWNPAGIAQVRINGLEAAWRSMSFDRQAGYLAYLHPFGKEDAAMALGWVYAGVADLYEYSLDGRQGDKLSNYTNAATFTFARRFTPGLSLGVTLRYVQQNIANINAYTIGFDFGAHIRFVRDWYFGQTRIPMSKVRLGASIQRVGQKYPWNTGKYWVQQGETGSSVDERFPLIARAGIAASLLRDRLLISSDTEIREKQSARLHLGVEGKPHPTVALRAGLDGGHPTLGAGLEPRLRSGLKIVLDYAFAAQPGTIDPEHVFSLGVRF
jgi:hypothetical protein